MGIEIERKFLVIQDHWKFHIEKSLSTTMRQGYLSSQSERVVRVRIEKNAQGEQAMLTIKGKASGISRGEGEYAIPVEEAQQLLQLCEQPLIEKKRHRLKMDDVIWEIDEFFGDNAGLVIAEVELQTEDQHISRPDWLGDDVSLDHRYANANLFKHPYSQW
jgi:adenylate cyclase